MATHVVSLARRLVLIILVVGIWYAVHPPRSIIACSCPGPGSPSEELAKAAVVFRGEVVAVHKFSGDDGAWSSREPVIVKFKVKTVWKGAAYQTRYIITSRSGASCG